MGAARGDEPGGQGGAARLLLRGARVRTMDPRQPQARGLAICHGRIAGVGDPGELAASLGPHRTVDLPGCTILPGLTDSHVHFAALALQQECLDLGATTSLAEALGRVAARQREEAVQGGQGWLLGRGWDPNLWPAGDTPDRWTLDRICGHRPVALASKDGHMLWVNGAALHAAGIDAGTPSPPGGRIEQDPVSAEPAGLLKETAADMVWEVVPEPDVEQVAAALGRAMPLAHRLGLTALHTPEKPRDLAAWQLLAARDELTLRVTYMPPAAQLPELTRLGMRAGFGDGFLRLGPVKLFADGTLTARTAAMLAPYEGEPDNTGVAVLDREELFRQVQAAVAAGWPAAVHAIGDRANRDALDAMAAAGPAPGGLRHRIEHAQLLHPDDLPRLAELGIVASMQPLHCTNDRDMADRWWGARARGAYTFRSLLDSGATLAFGSDAPVEDVSPWRGIFAAAARRREGREEEAWHPAEALGVEETLAAYTRGAARAGAEERWRGMLRAGMAADLVVLDCDPCTLPLDALPDLDVQAVMVGGRPVYGEAVFA